VGREARYLLRGRGHWFSARRRQGPGKGMVFFRRTAHDVGDSMKREKVKGFLL
jgi:hypothetical protein